MAVELEMVVCA